MAVLVGRKLHGEDHLATIRALTLVLDNNTRVDFNVASELSTPPLDDPMALSRFALKLPARLAFWQHQEKRALHLVRTQECDLQKLRAETHLIYRENYHQKPGYDVTEFGFLTACINHDSRVQAAERQMLILRLAHERVKAVADAVAHHCFIIPRLLQGERNTTAARS